MKKLLLLGYGIAGLALASQAQTLLYEWDITNATSTTVCPPSYAIGGAANNNLIIKDNGSGVAGTLGYFAKGSAVGPFGHGAMMQRGQTYRDSSLATGGFATNLNLGSLSKYTVTAWIQYGSSVGNGDGGSPEYTRAFAIYAANSPNFDQNSPGGTGVGWQPHGWNYVAPINPDVTGYSQSFQWTFGSVQTVDGPFYALMNPTNYIQIPGEPYQDGGNTGNGMPASDVLSFTSNNWYFVAMTFDGTNTTTPVNIYIGTKDLPAILAEQIPASAMGPEVYPIAPFGTNAILRVGNRTDLGRAATDAGFADIRIYSGVCNSNNLEAIRSFGVNATFVDDGSGVRNTAPTIPTGGNPVGGNTHPGGSRTFTVSAAGGSLHYQWKTNTVPVAGANSASFTLSNIQLAQNGLQVACTITNSLGTITSTAATLTVLPVNTPYAAAVMALNPYVYYHVNEASNSSTVAIYDYVRGLDGSDATPRYAVFGPGASSPTLPGFPAGNTSIGNGGITNVNHLNLGVLPSFTNGMTLCGWVYVSSDITNTTHSEWGGAWPIIYSETTQLSYNQGGHGYGLLTDYIGTDIHSNASVVLSYNWSSTNNNYAEWPGAWFNSGLIPPQGEWSFVALTIDPAGTSPAIYLGNLNTGFTNAVDDVSLSLDVISSLENNIAPLVLGRDPSIVWSSGPIACGQDPLSFNDVSVFYQALTFDQLKSLYTAAVTGPVTPIPLHASYSGGNISLSWSATGWTVAEKTTPLNTAGGWTDVAGTSSVTSTNITITPGSGPVFFRLHNP